MVYFEIGRGLIQDGPEAARGHGTWPRGKGFLKGACQPQPSRRPSHLRGKLRGLARAFPSWVIATRRLDACHFQGQPVLLSGV